VAIQQSLASSETPSTPQEKPDPFSLADPSAVERILDSAGFAEVAFRDVHEPVYYGQDVAAAFDWVRGFSATESLLQRLDAASRERALERLRETLAAHDSGRSVWFGSRAWIVTAGRR
jgi:hypothetical protein